MDERSKRIGRRIAQIRQRKGLTQQGLAMALAITRQQMGRLESGSRTLKPAFLEKIARALDIPLPYLENDDDPIGRSADHLTTLGFVVERNVPVRDEFDSLQTVDLRASIRLGPIEFRALVEHRFPLHQDDIRRLQALVDRNACHKAILLTEQNLGPNDRIAACAAERGVSILRSDELQARLVDFDPWCKVQIDQILSRNVHYVEPLCVPEDTGVPLPISVWLDEWLQQSPIEHAALIGEPGVGKSTVCHQLAARLARKHLETPGTHPIPILVHLWEYPYSSDIRELLFRDLLFRSGGCTSSPRVLESLLTRGRFVLLLDGLDEMVVQTREVSLRACLRAISPLLGLGSRVLLTTRHQVFRSSAELVGLLKPLGFWSEALPRLHVATLCPFDRDRVETYLRRENARAWRRVVSRLDEFGLWDLASLPLALNLLASRLATPGSRFELPRDLVSLLRSASDDWARQEACRTGIPADDILEDLEEFAYVLWSRDTPFLPSTLLPPRLRRHIEEGVSLKGGIFLELQGRDSYGFHHRTVRDYFLTKRIFLAILADDASPFATFWFDEGLSHLLPAWVEEESIRQRLLEWVAHHENPTVRSVSAYLLAFGRSSATCEVLGSLLDREPDLGVRYSTAWALVRLGQHDVIDRLSTEAVARTPSHERDFARMTLALLHHERWDEEERPLQERIEGANSSWGLAEVGEIILRCVGDAGAPEGLRCVAARLAECVGGEEISVALGSAPSEPGSRFRRARQKALERLPVPPSCPSGVGPFVGRPDLSSSKEKTR